MNKIEIIQLNLLIDAHEKWWINNSMGKQLLLENVSLEGLDLTGKRMSGAILRNVNFSNCKLNQSSFSETEIMDCKFIKADLTEARFGKMALNCDFSSSILIGAILPDMNKYCLFNDSDLSESNMAKSDFIECNFYKSILQGSNANRAKFKECIFTEASFINLKLRRTSFIDCEMNNVNFKNTLIWDTEVNNNAFSNVIDEPRYIFNASFSVENNPQNPKIFPNVNRYKVIDDSSDPRYATEDFSGNLCSQSGFWVSDDEDFEEIMLFKNQEFPYKNNNKTTWLLERIIENDNS